MFSDIYVRLLCLYNCWNTTISNIKTGTAVNRLNRTSP